MQCVSRGAHLIPQHGQAVDDLRPERAPFESHCISTEPVPSLRAVPPANTGGLHQHGAARKQGSLLGRAGPGARADQVEPRWLFLHRRQGRAGVECAGAGTGHAALEIGSRAFASTPITPPRH